MGVLDGDTNASARSEVALLVKEAATGNETAWNALVARFSGMVTSIARSYRLGRTDAEDVIQTVWLRLVEGVGTIRDPERVGAWLAAVTRHEALRMLRRAGREAPVADTGMDETPSADGVSSIPVSATGASRPARRSMRSASCRVTAASQAPTRSGSRIVPTPSTRRSHTVWITSSASVRPNRYDRAIDVTIPENRATRAFHAVSLPVAASLTSSATSERALAFVSPSSTPITTALPGSGPTPPRRRCARRARTPSRPGAGRGRTRARRD